MRSPGINVAAVLLGFCLPWLSPSMGSLVLCLDPCGRAVARVQPANGPAHCTECLGDHGCTDFPGKAELCAPAAGHTRTRPQPVRDAALPMATAWQDEPLFGLAYASGAPPRTDPHGTLCRLRSHQTVVLRL